MASRGFEVAGASALCQKRRIKRLLFWLYLGGLTVSEEERGGNFKCRASTSTQPPTSILGIDANYTKVFVGAVLVITVAVDQLRKRRSGQ
jgi:hypothetical protein